MSIWKYLFIAIVVVIIIFVVVNLVMDFSIIDTSMLENVTINVKILR